MAAMRPRPGILLTFAYGAGLATGLLHFGTPIGAATVLAVAPLLRHQLPTILAAGAMLGRVSAELAWVVEGWGCASRLPPGRIGLRVRLLEPADPSGGRPMVSPLAAGCTGSVTASWPAGHPMAAGLDAVVEGIWIPRSDAAGRPGGTLAIRSIGPPSGEPSPGARLRTGLAEASRSLYGARAPLVDALMLNRRGSVDPDLQQKFADAELVHLLSISGFHVGLITAWVFLFGRLFRLSRPRAFVLAALASAVYVGFLGWPAPATRAAALAGVVALCRI